MKPTEYCTIKYHLGYNKAQTRQHLVDTGATNIRYCGHSTKTIKNEDNKIVKQPVIPGFYYN
jgi:hypothetical protein